MLKVSWLHRFLRIKPGRVPKWVGSPSSCGGLDLFSIVGAVILFLALFLCRTSILLAAALVILLVLFIIFAMMPFEACERLARARHRRNECIFCGRALEKQPSENLQVCGCHPDTANKPQPQSGSPLGGARRVKMVD